MDLNFEEILFSPIPSQTNIYGLTKIDRNEEEGWKGGKPGISAERARTAFEGSHIYSRYSVYIQA